VAHPSAEVALRQLKTSHRQGQQHQEGKGCLRQKNHKGQ